MGRPGWGHRTASGRSPRRRDRVQVDISAYAAAHPEARRLCVNDLCAPVHRPATRFLAPNGTGRLHVLVTITGRADTPLLTISRTVHLHHPDIGGPRCETSALVGRLAIDANGGPTVS